MMSHRARRTFCGTTVLAAMSLLAAVPAQAQLAEGYSGYSSVRTASMEEFFWALDGLGTCLATSKAKQSVAFLESRPETPAEGTAVRQLLGNNTSCLRHVTDMRVDRALLRGAIAEAMYKRTVSAPLAVLPNAGSVPDEMSSDEIKARGYRLVADFASCIVATQPQLVHQLLTNSKLGSSREQEIVAQMSPTFTTCLPRKVELRLDPAELRLALAVATYPHVRTRVLAR